MSEWRRFRWDWDGWFEIGPICLLMLGRHGTMMCWKRVVKWELKPRKGTHLNALKQKA